MKTNNFKRSFSIVFLTSLLTYFSGCSSNEKTSKITFGNYINVNDISELEISQSELKEKLYNQNETLILGVYQGDYSLHCDCYRYFAQSIKGFINNYHQQVYVFNSYNQDDEIKDLKISKLKESTTYLYIFKGKTKIAEFSESNKKYEQMFKDDTGKTMYEQVNKKVKPSNLYFVNKEYLDENLSKKEESIVLFIRSGCGDCTYCLPNVIYPYINKNNINKEILIFDLQPYYNHDSLMSQQTNTYQEIKDEFSLSNKNNKIFGFDNGVVPSIQHYQKDELKDMSVYFNDTISKNENNQYIIDNTYYTEERKNNLPFLKNNQLKSPVLQGLTIDEGEILTYQDNYYWKQDFASKYHNPILEKFLDTYLK